MNVYIPKELIRHDLAAHVAVVDVTPELAEKWLAHNTHNRNRRHQMVLRFVEDMRADAWSFNGSSIVFADDVTLLDGQNRLFAVVDSGVTVPFIVVWGLAPSVQDDIDTGALRKLSDVLTLAGESNSSQLASLIRFTRSWAAGERRAALFGGQLSVAQGTTFLHAHPELRDICSWARARYGNLTPTLVGGLYWAFSRLDNEDAATDADAFFARLHDGQGLIKGDPIYELRRATEDRTGGHATRRTRTHVTALVIKAWNAYRLGETVERLRWRSGGERPEPFPEPT